MSDALKDALLPLILLAIALATVGYLAVREYLQMNSTRYHRQQRKKYPTPRRAPDDQAWEDEQRAARDSKRDIP